MLAQELARLIRFNSVSSRGNAALAAHVARMMRRAGFRVATQSAVWEGRAYRNVIGLKGPAGRPLMICAHLDTVPAGDRRKWTKTGGDPWRATRRGGRVWGLGAADDKASLLAMVRAGAGVNGKELKKPVLLAATFAEESGMQGANLFTARWRGPRPFLALVGEPTSLNITYRHKGMGVLELELVSRHRSPAAPVKVLHFKGKQGHSSRPAFGVNALEKAADEILRRAGKDETFWVSSLSGGVGANVIPGESRLALVLPDRGPRAMDHGSTTPAFPGKPLAAVFRAWRGAVRSFAAKDRSFDPPHLTSNFGVAESGPGHLRLVFDLRLLPGQTLERARREIGRRLHAALPAKSGVRWKISVERDNPPLGFSASSPAVRLVRSGLRAAGHEPKLVTKPSCTEAGVYAAWGAPAVVFGPGLAAGNIHAPNESVELAEIEKASALYRSLIRRLCGKTP